LHSKRLKSKVLILADARHFSKQLGFAAIPEFSATLNRSPRKFFIIRVALLQRLLYLSFAFAMKLPMKSLRVSIVEYLNTAPLVRGFTHGPLRGKYGLSFTVPSQCAEALRSGGVDVAIIPAIEYHRIPDLAILPNLSIASKQSVRSLLLISKKPI